MLNLSRPAVRMFNGPQPARPNGWRPPRANWKGKAGFLCRRICSGQCRGSVKARFNQFWDRIPDLFGTQSINLFQFLALMSIIINETGGSLQPSTEKVGAPGHPGIAYAFDRISERRKRSYNGGGNRTALALFNDPEFLAAHGHLPLAVRVRNTQDARWGGDQYPQGDFPTHRPNDAGGPNIIHEADFFKFRGRGLIQTTFREAYRPIISHIQANVLGHPILDDYRRRWTGLNPDTVATISTNDDWDRLFQQTDLIVPVISIRIFNRNSRNFLNLPLDAAVLNGQDRGSIWFVGRRISGGVQYANRFRQRVMEMLNALGNSALATP